jgi:disulfide oxidoreductase YuzD
MTDEWLYPLILIEEETLEDSEISDSVDGEEVEIFRD